MTELGLDPTIRNWVIVAPERSKRPDAFRRQQRQRAEPGDTCPAGFELGSGIPVNPSSPEMTAAALREAIAAKEAV